MYYCLFGFFLYILDINPLMICITNNPSSIFYGLIFLSFYVWCLLPLYILYDGECKQFTGPSECDHFLMLKPLFRKFY